MKKYDLVIFGSTFFAAGVASAYKKATLIIESKTKPGYEFIDAFHPGNYIDYLPKTHEGKDFFEYLKEAGLANDSYIPKWTPYLAKKITETSSDHLFLTDVINVRKNNEGYIITIFNSMGKSEIFAGNIIDTRTVDFERKTLNLLIKGNLSADEKIKGNIIAEYMDYSIYETMLKNDDDYPVARRKAVDEFCYINGISKDVSLVAIADEFYKKAKEAQKETAPGYIICASSYYDNPIEAYDMGAKKGAEIQ